MVKTMKNVDTVHGKFHTDKYEDGFTAIELLIAMAVFSFVLTLSTLGFIQINQLYQRGVATRQVQDATRYLQEDITRTLRESDYVRAESVAGDDIVCSDRHRFFLRDEVLYKQPVRASDGNIDGSCLPDDGIVINDSTEQITDDETVVLEFDTSVFNPLDDDSGYYSAQIQIRVGTSATQDIIDDDDRCDPSDPGAHFCAVSEQTTVITTRGAI